jgi:metal-sulfur cluster biosynthetic enzyme
VGQCERDQQRRDRKMTDETKSAEGAKAEAKSPIVAEAEKQEAILNALQAVLDPEIGLSVIDLDLIREVVFTPEEAEVRMVLTTPFCPYGPMLINQIQSVSEQAAEMPVKVTVLPDAWQAPPWLR